ncbi:MAG: F0F1 ATP synthase subunit epsilon [Candidatus Paralactobacillus gallistercoris]|uniref:ATP synthase epsilon chain n=1 Tax=Candidatus Paralactobacillus gallistercoris TaxID=2838724 RepID=A0A948TJV5_9LACO|nr:F0F1 ATP synthase subunit epsilon [Candidatus Paralactobacillus gallistercoris]
MNDSKSSVLTVNIVTPDGIIYNHPAKMLIVQAMDGSLGIMADHEPLVATLKIAKVRIKRLDDPSQEDEIAVNGGFLEMNNNIASIVADSAELKDNIDLSRAELARDRARRCIEEAKLNKDADSLKRATVALQRAMNRINVKNGNNDQ